MAQATPIGWYRMEGISGNQISTVTNSIGGGGAAPDANASGTAFNYSSVVAGPSIFDPITSTLYANNSSMAFAGGTANSWLAVTDGASAGPLDVPDFTIEMFVRIDTAAPNRNLISHGSGLSTNTGWAVRTVQLTSVLPSATMNGGNIYNNKGPAVDDGQWHHLALAVQTSDPGNNFARFYMDYELLQENTNPALDDYVANVNADLRIYANYYSAYTDEVRFSNTVLSPDDFLQVIPEPGTLALLGMGILATFLARRRCIR